MTTLMMIPSWRATKDIDVAEDVVEEIVRIYGYDNLKPQVLLVPLAAPEVNKERQAERNEEYFGVGASMNEVYNYSFVNEDKLAKLHKIR